MFCSPFKSLALILWKFINGPDLEQWQGDILSISLKNNSKKYQNIEFDNRILTGKSNSFHCHEIRIPEESLSYTIRQEFQITSNSFRKDCFRNSEDLWNKIRKLTWSSNSIIVRAAKTKPLGPSYRSRGFESAISRQNRGHLAKYRRCPWASRTRNFLIFAFQFWVRTWSLALMANARLGPLTNRIFHSFRNIKSWNKSQNWSLDMVKKWKKKN